LSLSKRQGLLTLWYSHLVSPGTNKQQVIDTHLETADVILLLVSADFLASDYCYGIEMKRALERHQRGEAQVIPILIRQVDWKHAPFAHLRVLPTNAKPLALWTDRDVALAEVSENLRRVIEGELLAKESAPHPATPSLWNVPRRRNPPDQSEGDVADIPFFPNPRIEEEHLHMLAETTVSAFSPQAEASQEPLPQDSTALTVRMSTPDLEMLSVEDQSVPPAPPSHAIGSTTITSRHPSFTAILFVGVALLIVGGSVGFFFFTSSNQPSPFSAYRTLALDDPLSDNSHGYHWDENNTNKWGTCAFAQGAYHVNAIVGGGTKSCLASNTTFSDFAYEVQVTIVKGEEGGILFHGDGNGNSYLFSINQKGDYRLWFFFDCPNICNISGLRSGSSPFINTGLNKSNLVAVVAKGSTIDLYVNNHKIDDVSDSTYGQGQIGVFAFDADVAPSEVVFSDAKVWTQ